MPFEKFKAFLKSNGVDFSLSAGAVEDGQLCGFILNGIRTQQGVLSAYDSGTGVVPEYRKRGLTKGMLSFLLPLLKEKRVRRYILEVIETNTPAFNAYRGFGFSVLRELICYKAAKEKLKPAGTGVVRIVPVSGIGTNFGSMQDYSPTWQNTLDSIIDSPEKSLGAVIEDRGETAGYGIINVRSGRVYQLAVNREMRRKGLGSALLYALSQQTESGNIFFLNVDSGCASMKGFLAKHGFEEYTRQYEMELKI